MILGPLKPGVTCAQAIADLNSVSSYLEKTYPKEDTPCSVSKRLRQLGIRIARAAQRSLASSNGTSIPIARFW